MSDGFAQMLELQTRFVEDARAAGIDVEVTSMRAGTALTQRTGIYAARHERERLEALDAEED